MDLNSIKCFVVMVLSQTLSAFFQPIFFRIAYRQGIELPIFIFYGFAAGFIFNLLLAVVFSECEKWPKLNRKDAFCALTFGPLGGPVPQNIYVLSFAFASSKLASIVATFVPIVVFALKVVSRKEKLSRSRPCVVKVAGMILILIASVVLQGIMDKGSLAAELAPTPLSTSISTKSEVVVGFLLCIAASTNIATWFTNYFLEVISPEFAYTFTMAALMNLFGALAAIIYAVCRYHEEEYYNLGLNTTMGVLVCFIVFLSVVATSGARWCVKWKGKSYVAAFSNLSLIVDTIAAPLVFDGKLQRGSVGSVVLIIIGVRLFQWGNTKEAAASIAIDDEPLQIIVVCDHHQEKDRIDDLESGFHTVVETEVISTSHDDGQVIEIVINDYDDRGDQGIEDTDHDLHEGMERTLDDHQVVISMESGDHHQQSEGHGGTADANDDSHDDDDDGGDQGIEDTDHDLHQRRKRMPDDHQDVISMESGDHHHQSEGHGGTTDTNDDFHDDDYDDDGGDQGIEDTDHNGLSWRRIVTNGSSSNSNIPGEW